MTAVDTQIWRATFTRYAPIILWVGVIFFLSSNSGSMSETSRIIGPLLHFLFPNAPEETIKAYHGAIRKAAHFTEYAILAWLTLRGLKASPSTALGGKRFVIAIALVAAVAVTDEFNQSFEASRTSSVYDVLLDILGGVVVVMVFYLIGRRRNAGT